MVAVCGPNAEVRYGRGNNDPAATGVVELLHGDCQNVAKGVFVLTKIYSANARFLLEVS